MPWSKDQRTPHRLEPGVAGVERLSEHPAKSVMARRWEERRARGYEQTPSGVQTLSRRSDSQAPAMQLDAMTAAAAHSGEADPQPQPLAPAAPAWLRNPEQALLRVALVSCAVLIALLYFGGFLG